MGHLFPRQILSESSFPLSVFTQDIWGVLSLCPSFSSGLEVYFRALFSWPLLPLFSVRHLYLYGTHRHQDLPATAVQILHFVGDSIQFEFVGFHVFK